MKKLESFALAILAKTTGITPGFWALLKPILLASGKQFLGDAVQAALPLVVDLEGLGIPSAEKRGRAVQALVAALLKDGKQLEQSVASLAVELALQKVRAASVATPPPTVPPVLTAAA